MNTRTWYTVALIAGIAALIGGGYYYNQKTTALQSELAEIKKVPLDTTVTAALQTQQQTQDATQSSSTPTTTQSTATTSTSTSTSTTTAKKTYTGDVFSFQYPSNWTIEQDNAMGERHAIFKKNGIQVAKLDCPIPAIGFENIKTAEDTSKTITKGTGATALTATLNLIYGSAWDPAEKDELIIIRMTKNNNKPDEQQGQYGTSCMLSAQKLALLDIFKDIYKSIALN